VCWRLRGSTTVLEAVDDLPRLEFQKAIEELSKIKGLRDHRSLFSEPTNPRLDQRHAGNAETGRTFARDSIPLSHTHIGNDPPLRPPASQKLTR
jgi:hypothetical protein